jgi:hypothetical protein
MSVYAVGNHVENMYYKIYRSELIKFFVSKHLFSKFVESFLYNVVVNSSSKPCEM